MSVVQLNLTAEQLAVAYTQLDAQERHYFLTALFNHPMQQQTALEFLAAAQATLKRKFSSLQQNRLDNLLDKNAEGKLNPKGREQLDELMAEYGEGLVEKARAGYILHLAQQAEEMNR